MNYGLIPSWKPSVISVLVDPTLSCLHKHEMNIRSIMQAEHSFINIIKFKKLKNTHSLFDIELFSTNFLNYYIVEMPCNLMA